MYRNSKHVYFYTVVLSNEGLALMKFLRLLS